MPYKPTWKERREDLKPYLGPIIAGVLVLAVGGWVLWRTKLAEKPGRRLVTLPEETPVPSVTEQRAANEVAVQEKAYQRTLETGAPVDEVVAALDRLIGKQRALIALQRHPSAQQTDKLARWEAARGSQHALAVQARSLVLEREAIAAEQAGQTQLAIEKTREALRLQREANAAAPTPSLKDVPREMRLAQEIAAAEAAPLHAATVASLAFARSAAAQEKGEEALVAFMEARQTQAEINRRFPGSRFADVRGVDKIDGEIQSLRAAGLGATAEARERAGDIAAAAGRTQAAAADYAVAIAALREAKERFPLSRFASDARIDELEVRRQTALSAPVVAKAVAIDREVAEDLRRRQNGAVAGKLAAAAKLMETAAAEFPRSRALDPVLRLRVGYLALRAGDLGALQEQVLARTGPLPGSDGARLLTTEVPQELYQRVMNANPSRQAGRGLPVDSVTWQEAKDFCERLSWLLGRRTRLPTEAEFRAVWPTRGEGAWSADNSDGRSHEVGTSPATPMGFFDLAGNVAEWLQTRAGEGETAPAAGGSYLDPAVVLRAPKVDFVDKRERFAHVGFRVVVEAGSD
ncbi:MAG: SUMF1/EgtB/PvdO family nonheme iron enzyme [Verrucomicrobia bacterium]|nr:SUMF1/EgtB/PvdO family nonheme iron enzyme [Verrucomicrobiota bacterium]